MQTSPCPCLVAAGELRLPLERVLAPIDISLSASGALLLALTWASALRMPGSKADLVALHVTQNPHTGDESDAIRDVVASALEAAHGAAQVEIRERVVKGSDAAAEILRQAASTSADLLVMGTHGREHASGDLGSVSAAVVQGTPCPLLLVPPSDWQSASGS